MNPSTFVVRRTGHVLLIVVFVGTLALPLAASLLGLAPRPHLQEKRHLAQAPEFRFNGPILAEFPARFEAYYEDHFAFRDQLVRWHNLVKVRWLKVSPRPNVLIGKEGWLYYQEGLLDHDHAITPLTDQQVHQWVQLLQERQQWLAARSIRFLVVIPPDKHTVYPEYLPTWVQSISPSPRLDQLLTYASDHSDLTILDLRVPLREGKRVDRLYHKTDTHWNYRGAFVGQQCIAENLVQWFPQVQPLSRSAFSSVSSSYSGDLGDMVGLSKSMKEDYLALTARIPLRQHCVSMPDASAGNRDYISEVADTVLPVGVVFHDSFGEYLYPFLSEHFRRIVYRKTTELDFDTQLIEREKPNVVILEFVERHLANDRLPINPVGVASR